MPALWSDCHVDLEDIRVDLEGYPSLPTKTAVNPSDSSQAKKGKKKTKKTKKVLQTPPSSDSEESDGTSSKI